VKGNTITKTVEELGDSSHSERGFPFGYSRACLKGDPWKKNQAGCQTKYNIEIIGLRQPVT